MGVPKGTLSWLRGGLQRFKRLIERLDGARQHPQELSAQLSRTMVVYIQRVLQSGFKAGCLHGPRTKNDSEM
jgi:hypothetical protein